jgi:catechol 2,3-dioxygenase-like lactoylglutathione lyase family enzyme
MSQSRVGHIVINIHPENMQFYKDLFGYLGWEVVRDQPDKFGTRDHQGSGVWFVCPAKELSNDYDGPGMNHLAVITDAQQDVDNACEYLHRHNVQLLFNTPRHRPEFCHIPKQTYYQVMFESPDKVLLEIYYKGPSAG